MPRVSDHDERRTNIARAFGHLTADAGPAAATFASLAREAGVSVGAIQHYFPDRAAVLRYSYTHGTGEMLQRIEDQISAGEARHESIATMTLEGLQQMLPLDDVRQREAAVYRSLLSEAPHDADLAELARDVRTRLRDRLATGIANAKLCGEVRPDVDEQTAARRLLAVTTGLSLDLSIDPDDVADIRSVLEPVLDTVFTHACRRHDV